MRGQILVIFLLLSLGLAPAHTQLRGHGGPVRALSISPDGQTAVSGSFDSSAIRWSLQTDTAEQVLRFHDSAVNAVSMSSDGRIATGGADARIAIWRPGEQHPQMVFQGHTAPVVALAFSPDGTTLASASWDRTARLWPLMGGSGRVLEGHEQNVNALAFMPDGRSFSLHCRSSPYCQHPLMPRLSRLTVRSSRRVPTEICIFCRQRASCAKMSVRANRLLSRSRFRPMAQWWPPLASAARLQSSNAPGANLCERL